MIHHKIKPNIYTAMKYLFLIFVLLVILIPMLHVFAVSLSSDIRIMNGEVTIFPKGLNFEAYKFVLSDSNILNSYMNTIVYTVVGTTLSLATTASAAYALSKKKLFLQSFWMKLIIFTMFFGGGMIPSFINVRNLGLYDTMWAVVLPGLVGSWNLIVMRSFFIAFPSDIEESGRVDGLNDIGVFVYLVLPVSKAVLSTVGLFYAVSIWNSYFIPFLYLESQSKFTLQMVLRSMLVSGTSLNAVTISGGDTTMVPETLKYATVVVAILPIMAVYPFLQKYFVSGVMVGSVKG